MKESIPDNTELVVTNGTKVGGVNPSLECFLVQSVVGRRFRRLVYNEIVNLLRL